MNMKKTKRTVLSKKVREKVYNKYGGRCAYCGCTLQYKEMQVDHFAPVHLFGDNIKEENLMPSCRMCNFYKNSLTISKFREQLGKITQRLNDREFIYRLGKKYGVIEENNKSITFYFESYDSDNDSNVIIEDNDTNE